MKSVRSGADSGSRESRRGALHVRIRRGKVQDLELQMSDQPRLIEYAFRGRRCTEAPEIAARICGIFSVAHQEGAVRALENALGITVPAQTQNLRRLLYCGEWIQSHALSIYMFHAPDFLGYSSAIVMAQYRLREAKRGLKLKNTGDEIVRTVGGPEGYPVRIRVGGFCATPDKRELGQLRERLLWARDAALETIRWVSEFPFPDLERDYEFVALSHPAKYPLNEGHISSSNGLGLEASDFEEHFSEPNSERSGGLHPQSSYGSEYLVGPLARYNLSFEQLSTTARDAAIQAGIGLPCRNPFLSIVVRAIEILDCCDEALHLIENYERPEKPAEEVLLREGVGFSCTEAPRGILYHRFSLDARGNILEARIIPPSFQNRKSIEEDLRQFIPRQPGLTQESLTLFCEHAIRNYDPCISCSTYVAAIGPPETLLFPASR